MDSVVGPAPTTVLVISHIPFLAGYYAQSLEILKRCLGSIRENTEAKYDLMLFDNASCEEVRGFLLEQEDVGNIDFLLLTERNLGKSGAWNMAFAAAPGETIAYADSDVYFHPGWLKPHLDALQAFPKTGMVTGMPLLTPEKYSTKTIDWAASQKDVKLERGQFISWEEFWRHASSLGDTEEKAKTFYANNESIQITREGKRYFVGAGHFQFVGRKAILQELLPFPAERPMGRVRMLDEMMNQKSYLRLSLPDWHVHHMGNTIPEDLSFSPGVGSRPYGGLWQWKPLRKLLQRFYDRIFHILYRSNAR